MRQAQTLARLAGCSDGKPHPLHQLRSLFHHGSVVGSLLAPRQIGGILEARPDVTAKDHRLGRHRPGVAADPETLPHGAFWEVVAAVDHRLRRGVDAVFGAHDDGEDAGTVERAFRHQVVREHQVAGVEAFDLRLDVAVADHVTHAGDHLLGVDRHRAEDLHGADVERAHLRAQAFDVLEAALRREHHGAWAGHGRIVVALDPVAAGARGEVEDQRVVLLTDAADDLRIVVEVGRRRTVRLAHVDMDDGGACFARLHGSVGDFRIRPREIRMVRDGRRSRDGTGDDDVVAHDALRRVTASMASQDSNAPVTASGRSIGDM